MNEGTTNGSLSWNTHSLLTRGSLSMEQFPFLEARFPVVRLEDFLPAVAGKGLEQILQWYWDLLDRKVNHNGNCNSRTRIPPALLRTEGDFIEAIKLNPANRFDYVRVVTPDEITRDECHDPSRLGPPGPAYVETHVGEELSVREILCTFCDEPDWGMDQDLFDIDRYGYGPAPFGGSTGLSSQAPFHVAFLFENPLLRWLVPSLNQSFLEERVRISFALARLAFNCGMDYWGWRFTAWGLHYLQDLTQPYHAKALPFFEWRMISRIALAGNFTEFAKKNKNLLRNRHLLFEAAVHFLVNEAFKNGAGNIFVPPLTRGPHPQPVVLRSLIRNAVKHASSLAHRIDSGLINLMADPKIEDPSYYLGDDVTYRIDETLPKARRDRPDQFERFIAMVHRGLSNAGALTRLVVACAQGSSLLFNDA